MFFKIIESIFYRHYEPKVKKTEDFPPDEESLVLGDLGENEDFKSLLRFYTKRDKNRYFGAGDERTRNVIRGQYIRTLYILKGIIRNSPDKKAEGEKKNLNTKISGRYAT